MKVKLFRPGWPSLSKSTLVILISYMLCSQAIAQIRISKNYERQANKILEESFSSANVSSKYIEDLGDEYHKYYSLSTDDSMIGSMLFASVRGRYDYFDYLLILDSEQKVKGIKILRYRSNHGYQIASKKWLEGFTGYDGQNTLKIGKDIDAISGATISSINLCEDLYFSINKLKQYFEDKPD